MREQTEERKQIWNDVLIFLAGELLGDNIMSIFLSHRLEGLPIAEGETLIDVTLLDHEKRFYDLTDAAFAYLRKNRKTMPTGEFEEIIGIASSLKSMFWCMIKLNHPAIMETEGGIGIRKDYAIVIIAPTAEDTVLTKLLKGAIPIRI